ncbi:Multidrug resistance protein, partial [Aspergillus sp. HF37]
HDPRHHRRERRREIDADVDPVRVLQTRCGPDPGGRKAHQHQRQPDRDPCGHRHGVPALQAGPEFHRAGEHHPGRRGWRPAAP